MESKELIEEVEKELQDLKHRILLSGGLMVDIPVGGAGAGPSAIKLSRKSRTRWLRSTRLACK